MFGGAKNTEKRHVCYSCKEELVFETKIGRRDMCPSCSAYLHCCLNCDFWDPNAHNQCTENQGEFIRDRAEGNFCGFFTFKSLGENVMSEADQAKAKLGSLFGGGPTPSASKPSNPFGGPSPSSEDAARARLDALFKKK